MLFLYLFFFKQKTAYEMRISDWSSDVCSSDLANWTATADVLLPLLDGLGGHPIVGCGHSMGAYILKRLASQRPAAFRHLVLIDPVIMDQAFYEGEAAKVIHDPADHPVARRRNDWTDVEEMRARFTDRPTTANWDTRVVAA